MKFEFRYNDEAFAFCKEIVEQMVHEFEIPEEEAIGRINQAWRDSPFKEDCDI